MDENRITYFAETDARNKKIKFGIKANDRARHVYVIGKTGMGKSTMLENMAVQDIQNGEGICFIDPHGKTADLLLEYVPKERVRDVIYIAPFDTDHPISFNVLESVDPQKRHLVSSGLMSTFKKIWEDAWSARMEYILTNTLLALLEAPGSTLLGVNRMLSDKEYRKEILTHVQDPSVKAFWVKEFANYTERMAAEAVPAIQNKVGQFTANPLIRNMIGQPVSSFNFREAMDKRKILIINLSKGKIGDENMKLLGGLLVTKIYLAAMSRADVPDRVMKMLPNFYLYVDEFQNFANASFADILSEARKYKLNLTIAHQYIEQMDEIVRPAVFGNVGTMIAFRVGATDAEELEKEFAPVFVLEDLVNLGFAQIYLKLMIDGLSSQPFSATTLPPISHPDVSYVADIVASSREQFSRPRAEVEVEIVKFHLDTVKKPAAKSAGVGSTISAASGSATLGAAATPGTSAVPEVKSSLPPPTPGIIPLAVEQAAKQAVLAKPAVAASSVSRTTPPVGSASSSASPSPSSRSRQPRQDSPQPSLSVESSQPSQPARDTIQTPPSSESFAPEAPTKPIALSSLEGHKQRHDPKVPSNDNVNALKSALASILAKNKSEKVDKPGVASKSASAPVPAPAPALAPSMPSAPASKPQPIQNASESTQKENLQSGHATTPAPITSSSAVNTEMPKEIPEQVLKKVLEG
jgi:energy-coupling factor transporter ATP-binding protein EcfA2